MAVQETIKTQVRIPSYLHRMVVESSELSGRSMNAEVVHFIEEGLKAKSFNNANVSGADVELFGCLSQAEQDAVKAMIRSLLQIRAEYK